MLYVIVGIGPVKVFCDRWTSILTTVGRVRMFIAVTSNRYRAVKEVGRIRMSVGIIAYYQRMQVCQVKLLFSTFNTAIVVISYVSASIFNGSIFYSLYLVPGLSHMPLNVYHFSNLGKRNVMQSSL